MTHVRQLALAGENGTIGRDVLVRVAWSCRVVSCPAAVMGVTTSCALLYCIGTWHAINQAGNEKQTEMLYVPGYQLWVYFLQKGVYVNVW
jgi:TRAP-type C4-dicarboxylate transport system permease small subunit